MDKEFMKKIGQKGGFKHNAQKTKSTLLEKYGSDYYSKIGKMGGRGNKRAKEDIKEQVESEGSQVSERHSESKS